MTYEEMKRFMDNLTNESSQTVSDEKWEAVFHFLGAEYSPYDNSLQKSLLAIIAWEAYQDSQLSQAELRVRDYAINEINEEWEARDEEYNKRLDECYDQARENGQEIEQIVDKDALYQSIMAQVEETRQYWLDRLEKQGASTRTLEAVRNA